MRKLLLPALILTAQAASAQTIDCPKFYPLTETVLSEVPAQHRGKGLLAQQPLTGAGMTIGEFNGGGDLQGNREHEKGGYLIDFGIPPAGQKWFVCFYGPNGVTSWHERLDDKEASCHLKVEKKNAQGVMDATLSCK